jgi:hypothetical protein
MSNTLKSKIVDLIESSANTNQTGLTLSPESGWGLTFQTSDLQDGEIMVISKEGLQEWADGHEWTDEQYDQAAEYITDNLGDWLYDLDKTERDALLTHIATKRTGVVALNYHGDETTFRIGDPVKHVTDDGNIVDGRVVALDAARMEIEFADGDQGWELPATLFKE